MQNQNIHYTKTIPALLIALVVACFGLSPAAQASSRPSIVGLWSVHYVSTTGGPEVLSYNQWNSDGLDIETPNFTPGVCMGTFKVASDGTVHLNHFAFTFDSTGAPSGHFERNLLATVSTDGKTYSGTATTDFYDVNGNFLFEDISTLTATRLTVQR
jgi:hypothetical protein